MTFDECLRELGVGLTFSAPWWAARMLRPRQAEIDQWRRWMDDQNL